MPGAETTFTLNFKTIAELTGLDRLMTGVQSTARTIQSINSQFATVLASAGAFLAAGRLNEYANMATKAREQQAAFAFTVLRSKDGSHEFLEELNKLNLELEETTDTSRATSRAIEQQFLIFQAGKKDIADLTRLTIDFAKARGMDPVGVSQMLSRAISGEDLALTRFGIHLDKTKEKTEQMRDLIRQLQAMVGGTAKVMADADGGITQSEFAWNRLKIGIGNVVNLVKVPFLLQLSSGLQDSRQKTDALTSSTNALGRTIYVNAGLVGHWIAEHIRLIQVVVAAGGALLLYRGAYMLLGASLSRFILPITIIIGALAGLDKALQTSTQRWLGFSIGLTETVTIMVRTINIVIETVKATVPAAVAFVSAKVKQTVHDAITELYVLAQAAAEVLQKITGGTVKLDFGEQILRHATDSAKYEREAAAVAGQIGKIEGITRKAFEEEFAKAIGGTIDRTSGKNDVAEKLKKEFKDMADFIEKMKADVGKAPAFEAPGDTAGAKTAATDALAGAKFRLASAEEAYRGALEQTKLLEEAGLITREQATARNLRATRDYIAELQRLRAALPALIAQLEAVGNTKGANEARLDFQQLTNKILEAQTTLAGSSFFGQMRAQIRQLANEWSNLGKQMGSFVTGQLQNLAQVGGQVISDLIFRTGNWKQAINQIGPAFVSQLATMLIQWVLSRTVMSALNRLFGAQDQAATAGQASAAAAAWAAPATAASIASSGVAAGSGLTAILIAMAAGVAAIIAMVAFKEGGYTGDGPTDEIAGVVHRGEVVFPAGRVREIGRDFLVQQAVGSMARPASYRGGGAGSGGRGGGSHSSRDDSKIELFHFMDPNALAKRIARSKAGTVGVIDAVNGNFHLIRKRP